MPSEIGEAIASAEKTHDKTIKSSKIIMLGVSSFLLNCLTWWLLSVAIYGHKPVAFWIWFIVACMASVAFTSFYVLVNPIKWTYALLSAVTFLAYVFIMPKDVYVIVGGFVFFLLSWLFQRRIRTEEKNQLHFSIRRTVAGAVLVATYGYLFIIGFNLYHNTSEDFKQNPQKFYDRLADGTARSVPFLSNNLPGINLNQPLDDYLMKKAESSLPQEMKAAPESVRNEYLQSYKDQFLRNLGITSKDNETIASAMSRLLEDRSRALLGRYEKFFPLIFTLAVIGLLRTFAFIFNWLTVFVSWFFFRILIATKFFKITKVQVEVDKLDV